MTSKKRLHLLENTLLVNIVPLLWGTFGPVVKLIQTIPPAIPTPLVNVSTYFSALLTVTILLRFQRNTTPTPARAGMELGFYLYLGGLLNIQGLTLTSASRAAFFVQLSTVFTPLMDRFRGNLVPLRVFGAAGFAMAGTCILAMHSHVDAGHTYPKLFAAVNIGDVFCIGTAFFYRYVVFIFPSSTSPYIMPSNPFAQSVRRASRGIIHHNRHATRSRTFENADGTVIIASCRTVYASVGRYNQFPLCIRYVSIFSA